jgi:hypothetical protein
MKNLIKIKKNVEFSELEESASLKTTWNRNEFTKTFEFISDSIRDLVFEECLKQNINPDSAKYFFSISLTIEGVKKISKDIIVDFELVNPVGE